jgi:hypothetical protein
MKKLILLSFILLFLISVRADNETYHDFKLETIIDDKINLDTEQNKFFKITYLNHTTGEKEQEFVEVYYNVTKNNSLLKEDFFNVTVNSYTTAKTGYYFFNETEDYKVCGEITHTKLNESNLENNKACKNFSVISTFNISCNVSLIVETEKLIYGNGEKLSFKNRLNNDSFKYKIEYWIEDLFGNIFKKPYVTENLNKKSYTPKIETKVEVLKIIANITYLACNDSNKSDNYFEKLFIVKNDNYKEEKLECPECECQEETTESKKKTRKTELEFVEIPKKITTNEEFKLKIIIENNDDKEHEFEIYSYVYRGSKCYSKSRENNKKTIKIGKFDTKIVELKDTIEEADDGDYKIKVRLKQDNLKTEKEITESIEIENKIEEKSIVEKIEIMETKPEITNEPKIYEYAEEETENIKINYSAFDYESSSEKSKKLINYLIFTTLVLVIIILVFKDERKRNKGKNRERIHSF